MLIYKQALERSVNCTERQQHHSMGHIEENYDTFNLYTNPDIDPGPSNCRVNLVNIVICLLSWYSTLNSPRN
jgi:hypothetical protein